MNNKMIIITVILVIAVGAGAFFAGTKYQSSKQPSFSRQFNGQGRAGASGMGNRMGFRPVNGEIISVDDKSITVKLQDGSSRIVLFTDKTNINKASDVIREDLIIGLKVAVMGTENTDGSVTAQNIQINPLIRELNSPNASAQP